MKRPPSIKAELILDEHGKPVQRGGHYSIRLSIADAPEDAHRVTWQLDESYYDPIRDARNPDSGFAEELTSYGDYEVKAIVRVKDRPILASRNLADALRETHGGSDTAEIRAALRAIAEN